MRTAPARARSVRRVAAAVSLGAALVSGCTNASEPASGEGTSPKVLQPGKPGEPARTIDPDSVTVADPWNHTDVAFMQMMIPHHAQALEMSRVAEERASDPAVRSMAERIRAAQGPEIMVMAAWLDERKMEVPRAAEDPAAYDHGQHGHEGMEGMLTTEQMEELEQARGPAFDRLFLRGMIQHHEGAVTMADAAMVSGEDQRVVELAADVSAGQAAEIARLEDLLARS